MALFTWEQLTSAGVFHYHDKMRKTIMTGSPVIRHDKNQFQKWLHKWFGTNRGTHWTVAGSVAVIILGSYLISDIRDGIPTTRISAAERAPASMTPGPFTSKR
jgi:hypothetical protein